MNRNTSSSLLPLLAASFFFAGCDQSAPADEDAGPDIAEVRATGSDIAESYALEDDHYVSPILDAPNLASRVGVMFEIGGVDPGMDVTLSARGIAEDGTPGPWVPLQLTWQEQTLRVAKADLEALSAGAQIRVPATVASMIEEITISALVPEPAPIDNAKVQGALPEYLTGAGVRSRAQWGARATKCTDLDGKRTRMAVHHTVSMRTPLSGGYEARLRQIQSFHMDTRGWCDVGYTFLVTENGTVWEGRPMRFVGAHVFGENSGNIGMSFVGCFHTSGCGGLGDTTPPPMMIDGAAKALGALAKEHGISISTSSLKGHRDHPEAGTSCPGDYLHQKLSQIREASAKFASDAPSCKSKFTDICGKWFEDDVIWLANEGISSGCASDAFCPDTVITREQMAAFLTNALGLPPGPDVFADDETSPFENAINAVAAAGITSGCSADGKMFCPKTEVTRGQMAAFLTKAFKLPPSSLNAFGDDDSDMFEASINAVAAAGITAGCNVDGTNFCPGNKVTRAQMAAFLRRAVE